MNFIKKELRALKKNFTKIGREFFVVMLLEAVYLSLVYLFRDPVKALEIVAAREMESIIFDIGVLVDTPELIAANITMTQLFIAKMILVMISYFVLHAVLYSIFNYLSWHRIADKHFDLAHAKGFVRISAVWVFSWMLAFALALLIFETWAWIYLFLAFTILFLHTTTMMNIVLIHNKKHCDMRTIFAKTMRMSFRKLSHSWAPYSSGALIVIVLGILLLSLLSRLGLGHLRGEFLLAYFIAFITWWRSHLYESLKHHTTKV